MTNQEKIDHFLKACVEDATERSDALLKNHEAFKEKEYSTKLKELKKNNSDYLAKEKEKLRLESNIALSIAQSKLREDFLSKRKEYEDMLFAEVEDMLERYTSTSEYPRYLEHCLCDAIKTANGEKVIMLSSEADEELAKSIAIRHSVEVKISEENLEGGCQFLIPARNLLINNSFKAALAEIRKNFRFM